MKHRAKNRSNTRKIFMYGFRTRLLGSIFMQGFGTRPLGCIFRQKDGVWKQGWWSLTRAVIQQALRHTVFMAPSVPTTAHLEGVLVLVVVFHKVSAQHRGPLVAHGLCCVHLPPEQWDGAVGQGQVQHPGNRGVTVTPLFSVGYCDKH